MKLPGQTYLKRVGADEPLGFDWSAWLTELGSGVSIAVSTWTITGSDSALTKHDASILANGKTQVYFAAGTVGVTYLVTNAVQTSAINGGPAAADDRSFYIKVIDN